MGQHNLPCSIVLPTACFPEGPSPHFTFCSFWRRRPRLEAVMKEFIIFDYTDSTEIFFSKLRSAGLNYNLPSFFTDLLCGGIL